MAFIHDDFLLHSPAAVRLYHEYAKPEPILDFHSHLSPKDIAENRRFKNLYEIWLEGDHYKWRAMRANGIPEKYCTGDAEPFEKYLAWADTVPYTLRNPLYHWTHLELKRYFGIDELLDEHSAEEIWKGANEKLASESLSAHGILQRFDVRALCTTDDPADDLHWHEQIAKSGIRTKVYPTFRPDRAMEVHEPQRFNQWVARLEQCSNVEIRRFQDLLKALRKRHDDFHAIGCRLSDHGLPRCAVDFCLESEASAIFDAARAGRPATPEQQVRFASFMMLFFGHLDSTRGWTKQLHLGPRRNANTRMMQEVGPDTGFDSMGDFPQAEPLCRYLDVLNREDSLPKMIVYNMNPADTYAIATMLGNFQDGITPGKLQLGAAWWYLDQKDGIEQQLNALSNTGLLSRFVGMLTDSRSFLSFSRHEYFRRVLCNLLGREMENGELPGSFDLVGGMVRNICFANAREYLGLVEPS